MAAREASYKAMYLKAARLQSAVEGHLAYIPDAEGVRLSHIGRILYAAGLSFILLCGGCLLAALVRRESGLYSIPLALMVFAVAAWMLL
jgi:hypothetical protein